MSLVRSKTISDICLVLAEKALGERVFSNLLRPTGRRILVKLKSERDRGSIISVRAILYLFTDDLKVNWEWPVATGDFEVIHGLSRIIKLIPDKLATAISINKENLPDPKDDGTFLIDLLTTLLVSYRDLIRDADIDPPIYQTQVFRLSGTPADVVEPSVPGNNLQSAMTQIYVEMLAIKTCLRSRNVQQIETVLADKILSLSTDVLATCVTYLEFVYPLLVDSRRHGRVSQPKVLELGIRVNQKLRNVWNKLSTEFYIAHV